MDGNRTTLKEVIVFEPKLHYDERGFLLESYRADLLKSYGVFTNFVQENVSKSKVNVLRGLHYQLNKPQAKLCWVLAGAVIDVAVDIRIGSPTFGQHIAVYLSSDNLRMLYIPKGFAHGVLILKDDTVFQYKSDEYYSPHNSYGISWNDPSIGIDWGINDPILSQTDQNQPLLSQVKNNLPVYSTQLLDD
jgi:dTDP-4-dehydrorhamnose 3,5-epimerase